MYLQFDFGLIIFLPQEKMAKMQRATMMTLAVMFVTSSITSNGMNASDDMFKDWNQTEPDYNDDYYERLFESSTGPTQSNKPPPLLSDTLGLGPNKFNRSDYQIHMRNLHKELFDTKYYINRATPVRDRADSFKAHISFTITILDDVSCNFDISFGFRQGYLDI